MGPRCSSKVMTSAMVWQGWESSVRPLITGTLAKDARSCSLEATPVRIMMTSTYRDSTRAVSATVSPRWSWVALPSSITTSPPNWRMPTSKETRVRVDGFSKIMARVFPASGLSMPVGGSPRL